MGVGGPSDFLGLTFWPKVIFSGLYKKTLGFFWVAIKNRGIFWGCEKGLRDFLGYDKKSSDFFG